MKLDSATITLVSVVCSLTYLRLAAGRIPGLRMDRAEIALVAAAAMLGAGALPNDLPRPDVPAPANDARHNPSSPRAPISDYQPAAPASVLSIPSRTRQTKFAKTRSAPLITDSVTLS